MSKINEEGLPRSEPWFLPFNKDAKVLCVYIALFFLISVAQFVASLPPFANSLALRADCVSMAVDTLTYCGNLLAVVINGTEHQKRTAELVVSGVSLLLLVVLTAAFTAEAVDTIRAASEESGGGDVDVRYVLAFSILGLVFDGSGIVAFFCCPEDPDDGSDRKLLSADANAQEHNAARQAVPAELGTGSGDDDSLYGDGEGNAGSERAQESQAICGVSINMLSANAHLISDTLRSFTTLVEAIVIETTDANSTLADGVSALVICVLIMIGGVFSLIVWVKEAKAEWMSRRESSASNSTDSSSTGALVSQA